MKIPEIEPQQRRLARSRCGRRARAPHPARPRARRRRSAQTSLVARAPPGDDDVLERPVRAFGDPEALRHAVDDDLAGRAHRLDPTGLTLGRPRARLLTISARTSTKSGSAFGISIRLELHPELGRLLLRLGVDVPADLQMIGHEPDGTDEHAGPCRPRGAPARWSRMSGPSHGSPVGDSLWNENDQSSTPASSATSAEVSSSWSRYGSPISRMRAGSEWAVKTTCAVGAADPVGEERRRSRGRRASSRRRRARRRPSSACSSWSR